MKYFYLVCIPTVFFFIRCWLYVFGFLPSLTAEQIGMGVMLSIINFGLFLMVRLSLEYKKND